MTRFALRLFGAPRLERDGAPVVIDTRKALALLAYLVVTGRRHEREALAALLWPDYEDGRAALRRTLSSLSHAVNGALLAADRESIGLADGGDLWVDVPRFRTLLAHAERHGHAMAGACPTCVTWLEEAVTLAGDDFLAGFHLRDAAPFDDWRFFQAESLRRELAGALDRLVAVHAQAGAYETAIGHARRRLALDPLHEPAHRDLMRLYTWAGQRAAALRQYERCARLLQDELGEAPQPETTATYQAIRASAGPPPPAAPAQPTARAAPAIEPARADAREAQSPATPDHWPLVGRAAEWAVLLDRYAAVANDGQVVAIEGEAGIGKTRLVGDLLAAAHRRGAAKLTIRCYEGQAGLAYAPVVEALRDALGRPDAAARLRVVAPPWLAEATRLLPELAALAADLPAVAPLDSPGAQARFLEGLAQVLLALVRGDPPGAVAVDDAHWADAATLDLLTYLIRRLPGRPLLLVVTWRGEEAPADHRLRAVLADALRAGSGAHLTLARLSRDDVAALVAPRARAGGLPAGIVERVYAETDGNPFFLVEYLAALTGPDAPGAGDTWTPPGSVRALLRSRLATVSPTDRPVLATAAVMGRSFDVDTLQRSAAMTEEAAVAALERLLARGLIREAGGDERRSYYDFSHDQLRALVYDEISHARRRLLHRRVAEALVATGAPAADGPLAGRIARHYEQAGLAAEAARAFRQAGAYARGLYANTEALGHFRAALALGDPAPAGLHEAIGDLQTLLGDYGAAIASYTAAMADPDRGGALAHKVGGVHHRRGEFARADAHYQAAQASLTADADLARLYADWSLTASQQGDLTRAADLARRALVLAEAARDRRALAQAHNVLGLLAHGQGVLPTARAHLEQSLALADALDDREARVAALTNLALVAEGAGRLDDALALAEAALALCTVQGDRHREAALHSRLADLLHEAGRLEPAMAHLKQAVRIYAEIGVEAGAVQPSIWTLRAW